MPKSWSTRFILGAGAATTAIGLLVLAGWVFRSVAIIQIHPWYAPMQRNTAFGFVLCRLGFLLSNTGSRGQKCSEDLGLAAAILGFATLLEYGFSIDLHINEAPPNKMDTSMPLLFDANAPGVDR